jgi:hypothetical protein
MRESAHPLLLPGIFVEIERIRHLRIFESTIDDLEKAMPNTNVETMLNQQSAQIEALEQNKRSAYLEVLHLKQGLESWSTQLQKMVEHAQSLRSEYMSAEHILGHSSIVIKDSPCLGLRNLESSQKLNSTNCEGNLESWCSEKGGLQWECTATNVRPSTPKQNTDHVNEVLVQTTSKVTRRLRAILDEYTDKGRECQIRFDGITIATQLVSILIDIISIKAIQD